jgi:hypothetical protein
MSSLFGVELPTPVNFVIAFLFVLLLIGAAAWLVRRFGATRTESMTRGRQPRLAVVDFAAVDSRRKLVIVRRDNVEHLLMIGGPSDVVVETNIVRGAAVASREASTARNGSEPARAVPVPDPTPWPLQPETATAIPPAAPVRVERSARVPSDEAWQAPVEPAVPAPPVPEVRPVRPADTLAGLAEDLARPTEPVAVRPVQVQPQRLASTPAGAAISAPPATDQSLAEMAQRLEAALRRPNAQKVVTETQRVTATVEIKPAPPKAAALLRGGTPPKPQVQPQPQTQPQQQNDLEQEMASLLSRPGKT